MKHFLVVLLSLLSAICVAQTSLKFPDGKKSLIVLTYDDALNSHLDIAIPQLDKANLKGTFFLNVPAEKQISRWREAAKKRT